MKTLYNFNKNKLYNLFLFLLTSQPIYAFEFMPLIAAIEATGNKSEQVYLFTNTSAVPAPIQVKISSMRQNEDGSESRSSAEHLFQIQPYQAVVPVGSTQKIRVRWIGGTVQYEQAYRFGVRQLPIQFKQEGLNLSIISGLDGILYIRPIKRATATLDNKQEPPDLSNHPKSTIPNPDQTSTRMTMLKIVSVIVRNDQGKHQLIFKINNPTNEHIIIKSPKIELKSENKKITLSNQQLNNLRNQNILGQSTRIFTISLPKEIDYRKQWQGVFLDD